MTMMETTKSFDTAAQPHCTSDAEIAIKTIPDTLDGNFESSKNLSDRQLDIALVWCGDEIKNKSEDFDSDYSKNLRTVFIYLAAVKVNRDAKKLSNNVQTPALGL
jgi:hypothetical protein